MLALAIVLVIVPAIEMICPIFSRCEQEDEFFPEYDEYEYVYDAAGIPLTELTALVRFQLTCLFYLARSG